MPPAEIIYSQQSSDFIEGRAYANPKFFSTPRSGVKKVFVVGEWPNIVEAYEALGVEVESMDAGDASRAEAVATLYVAPTLEERAAVEIPDGWADLEWARKGDAGVTLRALANQVSDAPVINKEQAAEAIQAELDRRAALTA